MTKEIAAASVAVDAFADTQTYTFVDGVLTSGPASVPVAEQVLTVDTEGDAPDAEAGLGAAIKVVAPIDPELDAEVDAKLEYLEQRGISMRGGPNAPWPRPYDEVLSVVRMRHGLGLIDTSQSELTHRPDVRKPFTPASPTRVPNNSDPNVLWHVASADLLRQYGQQDIPAASTAANRAPNSHPILRRLALAGLALGVAISGALFSTGKPAEVKAPTVPTTPGTPNKGGPAFGTPEFGQDEDPADAPKGPVVETPPTAVDPYSADVRTMHVGEGLFGQFSQMGFQPRDHARLMSIVGPGLMKRGYAYIMGYSANGTPKYGLMAGGTEDNPQPRSFDTEALDWLMSQAAKNGIR